MILRSGLFNATNRVSQICADLPYTISWNNGPVES
jgi:hypothetical protein